MPVGRGETDFTLGSGAPVKAVRCLTGPTQPRRPAPMATPPGVDQPSESDYLSLTDTDDRQGAAALRELLALYGDLAEASVRRQIDGVVSIQSRPITRRAPVPGPIAFARVWKWR